jgi:SAM-dependent methyltransferase
MFSQRKLEPEILDHLTPEEARPNLADLVRINKHFGGLSVLRQALSSVSPPERATFLDIGAASGDSGRMIRDRFPGARVVSLDANSTNLEGAAAPKLLADAFSLPFPPASFDYVFCSLFLHHFDDDQVVELLSAFYRVARRALIVSDLERRVIPYLFLPASSFVLRWHPVTVSDGMKSVRAAFLPNELRNLAQRAGIPNPRVRVHRPAFRIALVGVKQEAGGHSEEIPTGARTAR